MPLPPSLVRYCIEWCTTQTMAHAQRAIVDEVKSRVEKGDLGSYDGVLFKDSIRAPRSRVGKADLGIVAETKDELVGVLDCMGTPKVVKGDRFKYYIGSWKGVAITAVETGAGFDRARLGTEALLQTFNPDRVVCIGFVKSLKSSLAPGSFFVPNSLMTENGSRFELTPSANASGERDENNENLLQDESEKPDVDERPEASADNDSEPAQKDEAASINSTVADFLSRFATGALVCADLEKAPKADRSRWSDEFGASAYNRETLPVARTCADSNVPFLALNVVFDSQKQAGSQEAARFAKSGGVSAARTLGAFFGAVTKRPSSALDMFKLQEQSIAAADKLAKALGFILDASSAETKSTRQASETSEVEK